jgi:hypothetical protein
MSYHDAQSVASYAPAKSQHARAPTTTTTMMMNDTIRETFERGKR